MKAMILLATSIMAGGCTIAPPARLDVGHCPIFGDAMIECVNEAYDDQRLTNQFHESCTKWAFLDGMEPPAVADLQEAKRLEIHSTVAVPIITTLMGMGLMGQTTVYPGECGDIGYARIYSLPVRGVYAHEVAHLSCDDPPYGGGKDTHYTTCQLRMMTAEGVTSWTATSYYRALPSDFKWPRPTDWVPRRPGDPMPWGDATIEPPAIDTPTEMSRSEYK